MDLGDRDNENVIVLQRLYLLTGCRKGELLGLDGRETTVKVNVTRIDSVDITALVKAWTLATTPLRVRNVPTRVSTNVKISSDNRNGGRISRRT